MDFYLDLPPKNYVLSTMPSLDLSSIDIFGNVSLQCIMEVGQRWKVYQANSVLACCTLFRVSPSYTHAHCHGTHDWVTPPEHQISENVYWKYLSLCFFISLKREINFRAPLTIPMRWLLGIQISTLVTWNNKFEKFLVTRAVQDSETDQTWSNITVYVYKLHYSEVL